MVFNHLDPNPILEPDNSTIYTAATPPETLVPDFLEDDDPLSSKAPTSSSSIPWPGSTFILRCVSSGHVLTLLDGEIKLAPAGNRGSIHWNCIETKGWLGFQNPVSGRYLGHDAQGKLIASAGRHQGWENFCVRLRPEGGYVLLMTHFERLWPVGMKLERGVENLAKVEGGSTDGIVWEFVKV
jgi:hypothetical protein